MPRSVVFARTLACGIAVAGTLVGAPSAFAYATATTGSVVDISTTCSSQNAEVEQTVDPTLGYVYEDWMGCNGIAFARSTDGGRTFDPPLTLPGGPASSYNAWDPSIAVATNGTIYAAWMISHSDQWYPVVAASTDHGQTFSQVGSLVPPDEKNWGDRDFIAVGPDGTLYLTWDYGPDRKSVTFLCSSTGSCGYATGQLNEVLQRSTDGGKTWSRMFPISPGFPTSGGDSGPLLVESSGRIDVLYQQYPILDRTTYALGLGHEYFTSSTDRGTTWSQPVAVGPNAGTMSLDEWWIDGAIGADAGGTLYAVWDTQDPDGDTGWLSYSSDHGASWSTPIQVPPDRLNVPHIMEVAGGGAGTAYVSFLSSADPRGYAEYLRTFSLRRGLGAVLQASPEFGDTSVWPGDTTGISRLAGKVLLSYGSATPSSGKKSDIWVAAVTP
jgi:hypothetical protein